MTRRFKRFLFKHHALLSVLMQAGCCALAFFGAFLLRFDLFSIPEAHLPCLWLGLPLVVGIQMMSLGIFKVHRGLYRYVSLHDFVQLMKAVALGSVLFTVFWLVFLNQRCFMPRSIFLLNALLSLTFLAGLRISVRLWRRSSRQRWLEGDGKQAWVGRALIVGAGNMGETVLRMVDRRFAGRDYDVVGFVDDDSQKQKCSIHGVEILGRLDDIPELILSEEVGVIIFAIMEPPEGVYSRVLTSCEGLEVRFNTVSFLRDVSSGEVSVDQMRKLRVEDLLGRKPVKVDPTPVEQSVRDRVVLVTGAGGSIGSELSRQLAGFEPLKLILVDSAESPLFEIDRSLRHEYPELVIEPVIVDIKNREVVERLFERERPEYVYHAAAYKHVPLMEAHPDEAILNNVSGTRIVAEAALKYQASRFILISSDKAVRPTNVMGATKRLCELVIQSMNGEKTIFTAVRFGNVLGSNGSVIPIFRKQLEEGGPLTITHRDMSRYFMTIPEAVTLVLQCGTIATAGDIFVLEMGEPVRILDLAKNMIRLSGLQENIDVSIKETGLRPGEKMFEELVAYGEELAGTGVEKVNVLKRVEDFVAFEKLHRMITKLEGLAHERKVEESRQYLRKLIDWDIQRSRGGHGEGESRELLAIEGSKEGV